MHTRDQGGADHTIRGRDLLYIVHGHGRPEQEHSGVGFIVTKGMRKCITGVELGRDDRILALGLDLAPRHLTVITAHAPHSRRPEEETKTLFEELYAMVGDSREMGAVLVIGDLSAIIHDRLRGEEAQFGAAHLRRRPG